MITFLAAGIGATALLPFLKSRAWMQGGVIFPAAIYLALQLSVTILAGWLAFMLFKPRLDFPIWASLRRFAVASIWFAPATVFAKLRPSWGVVVAGAIAIVLAQCIRDFQSPFMNEDVDDGAPAARLKFVFVAAVALQAGTIAFLLGYFSPAALLSGLGCFLIAWQAVRKVPRRTNGKGLGSLVLAFALVALGLVLGKKADFGFTGPSIAQAAASKNLRSGVILLAEPKRHVLPAPAPLLLTKALPRVNTRPTSIPFSGEYWFFFSLFRMQSGRRIFSRQHPPQSSGVEHGDPTAFTFNTPNRWTPLVMKAHQPLGNFIDVSCCERIDVSLINADSQPDTVSIELILLDSTPGQGASQSLGELAMPPKSQETTLRFDVPRRPIIHRFDQIEVEFHLEQPRLNISANVAINRFDLIPRGL